MLHFSWEPAPHQWGKDKGKQASNSCFTAGASTGKPNMQFGDKHPIDAGWGSHINTIFDVQLQKTAVLRTQPRRQATLSQLLQCDLQRQSWKTQWNYVQCRRKLQLQNRISRRQSKKQDEAHEPECSHMIRNPGIKVMREERKGV